MLTVKLVFLSSIYFSFLGKRRGKERLIDVKKNQMIDIVIILRHIDKKSETSWTAFMIIIYRQKDY